MIVYLVTQLRRWLNIIQGALSFLKYEVNLRFNVLVKNQEVKNETFCETTCYNILMKTKKSITSIYYVDLLKFASFLSVSQKQFQNFPLNV